MKLLVTDATCNILEVDDAKLRLSSIMPFKYLLNDISLTNNPDLADGIFPIVNQYLGLHYQYDKLKTFKLYKMYGHKFIFYTLDDLPYCIHDDSIGIKFSAMPLKSDFENKKNNIIMIPLIDDKILFNDEAKINQFKDYEKEYEFVFIGAIGTSGRKSVRTQRDFVLNFKERDDSLIIDTTNYKSIFHIKHDWKIHRFQSQYLENLAKGKFGFCHVGQGLNSYRIGECMRIGIVPIIVGHKCLPLETYINWNEFALIFEDGNDVTHENIKKQLGNRNSEDMGKLCIDVWEKYFRPTNLSKFLYKEYLENRELDVECIRD